jgi:protein gp37
LLYELVRGWKVDYELCKNADAYHATKKFFEAIEALIQQLRGGCHRSYGVRTEYRGSVQAVKAALDEAFVWDKVRVSLIHPPV